MTKREKCLHDFHQWADQLRDAGEAYKRVMGSQPGLDELVADYKREVDGTTAHLIEVMQVKMEGEIGS